MRILKLSAYTLFALLLPVWLYMSTKAGIDMEKGKNAKEDSLLANRQKLETLIQKTIEKSLDNSNSKTYSVNVTNNSANQGTLQLDEATKEALRRMAEAISNNNNLQNQINEINTRLSDNWNPQRRSVPENSLTNFHNTLYIFNDTLHFPTILLKKAKNEKLILRNNLINQSIAVFRTKSQVDSLMFDSDALYFEAARNFTITSKYNSTAIDPGMDHILVINSSILSKPDVRWIIGVVNISPKEKKPFKIAVIYE